MPAYVPQKDSARFEVWPAQGDRYEIPATGWYAETAALIESFSRGWCLCDTTFVSDRRPIASRLDEVPNG